MAIYKYKYGLKDFIKILFYKKRCPYCNMKIKRKSEEKEYVETDQSLRAEFGSLPAYEVTIYYFCEDCNKRIEIFEL